METSSYHKLFSPNVPSHVSLSLSSSIKLWNRGYIAFCLGDLVGLVFERRPNTKPNKLLPRCTLQVLVFIDKIMRESRCLIMWESRCLILYSGKMIRKSKPILPLRNFRSNHVDSERLSVTLRVHFRKPQLCMPGVGGAKADHAAVSFSVYGPVQVLKESVPYYCSCSASQTYCK